MGNYTNYILSKIKLLNEQNDLIKNIDILKHVIKKMLFKNKKTLKDFYEELKLILQEKKGVNLSLEHIEIFKEIFKRSLYFKDKAFIHELYNNRENGLEIAINDIHSLKILM